MYADTHGCTEKNVRPMSSFAHGHKTQRPKSVVSKVTGYARLFISFLIIASERAVDFQHCVTFVFIKRIGKSVNS